MKVHLDSSISFYLLIGTLLTIISNGIAFTCPEHCHCVEMHKRYTFNHAKCTSLDGLRVLGKTSDLHSLDLSSLNLTKINNQLDKLTNLSKLDLSDNRLSEINALSTKRLKMLNLAGNRITSGKLSKIPATVKTLNLTSNQISILRVNDFKRLVHLRSIELTDNPLNCTCETLEIRNWLQERQVWTGPILCSAPIQFKGWPWLAARQSEVCDPNGFRDESPRMLPSTMDTTADNDLMIGDDPNVHKHVPLNIAENDEGFLPVRAKRTDSDAVADSDFIDHEGSGSDDDVYEGSGSTENLDPETTEASVLKTVDLDGNDQISNETQSDEDDRSESSDDLITVHDSNQNSSVEAATVVAAPAEQPSSTTEAVPVLAVASENDDSNTDATDSTVPPVVEETIVPVKNIANDAEYIQTHDTNEKDSSRSEESKIDESSTVHEGNSTYVLLAILGILLVALILYVAAKRSKANTKNRRNNNDIESPAQEMLTMDKNNLGKPMQNPVEFIPLIDPEKKAAVTAAVHNNKCNGGEEPLLQKLTEVENDREPNLANGNGTHQLNGNAKPVSNGINTAQPDSNNKSTNENDQRQFQSISPKPSRYSPVYMHDTGRLKIKLTETMRPKTPILVTRSKANADDNQYENTISQ